MYENQLRSHHLYYCYMIIIWWIKRVISFCNSNLDTNWNMAGSPRLKCFVVGSLLLLLLFSTICSGQTTYYIKPTPSTACPSDPCLTLSEYTQQPLHYLTSNTTLLLLPGDHVLSTNFTVENVSGFEVMSFTPAHHHATRIVCQGLVGFSFRKILHLAMHGLTINSCGKVAVMCNSLTAYGVLVDSVLDTSINNCSFQYSVGTALGVFHSSLDLRGSNRFTSNCRGCIKSGGGGIHACESTLSFNGNSIFRNNSAEFGGGLYTYGSTLNFSGNSIFGSNSAVWRRNCCPEQHSKLLWKQYFWKQLSYIWWRNSCSVQCCHDFQWQHYIQEQLST